MVDLREGLGTLNGNNHRRSDRAGCVVQRKGHDVDLDDSNRIHHPSGGQRAGGGERPHQRGAARCRGPLGRRAVPGPHHRRAAGQGPRARGAAPDPRAGQGGWTARCSHCVPRACGCSGGGRRPTAARPNRRRWPTSPGTTSRRTGTASRSSGCSSTGTRRCRPRSSGTTNRGRSPCSVTTWCCSGGSMVGRRRWRTGAHTAARCSPSVRSGSSSRERPAVWAW